jgi:hypothetical protein
MEQQAKEKQNKELNKMISFIHIMHILYLKANNILEVQIISISKMDILLLLNKLFFFEVYILHQARKPNHKKIIHKDEKNLHQN